MVDSNCWKLKKLKIGKIYSYRLEKRKKKRKRKREKRKNHLENCFRRLTLVTSFSPSVSYGIWSTSDCAGTWLR